MLLKTKRIVRGGFCYEQEMDSTNARAKKLAENGTGDGTVVLCEVQTAGRGRLSRIWLAKPGEDLTFSVVLRISDTAMAPYYSFCAALALQWSLEKMKLPVRLKWPNDVLLDGKKTAGILCELVGDRVIIGIGLNVNRTEFPEELAEKATSMRLCAGQEYSRENVLADVLYQLEKAADVLETEGTDELLRLYRLHCATIGAEIMVSGLDGEYAGVALDVLRDGALSVKKENGEICTVYAGDVSVRGLAGYGR